MHALPLGRPSKPDRIIDLRKFAQWVQDCRIERGWSLEVLARHISQAGYPISQNKLYRIEQNLKEGGLGKRPLQTIDYELLIRLEDVLNHKFLSDEGNDTDEMVSTKEVVELINNFVAKDQGKLSPPSKNELRKIYDVLKVAFDHC